MQLLGRAKLKGGRKSLRKGEVLKGGEFPKGGGEIPRIFAPPPPGVGAIFLGISPPRGPKCRGGGSKNPGTPEHHQYVMFTT